MGRMKNGTICSKHEDIKDYVDKIIDLVEKCLEDGQNMEKGLEEKKERISELEEENEDLKKELSRYETTINDLNEHIAELKTKIKEQEE